MLGSSPYFWSIWSRVCLDVSRWAPVRWRYRRWLELICCRSHIPIFRRWTLIRPLIRWTRKRYFAAFQGNSPRWRMIWTVGEILILGTVSSLPWRTIHWIKIMVWHWVGTEKVRCTLVLMRRWRISIEVLCHWRRATELSDRMRRTTIVSILIVWNMILGTVSGNYWGWMRPFVEVRRYTRWQRTSYRRIIVTWADRWIAMCRKLN